MCSLASSLRRIVASFAPLHICRHLLCIHISTPLSWQRLAAASVCSQSLIATASMCIPSLTRSASISVHSYIISSALSGNSVHLSPIPASNGVCLFPTVCSLPRAYVSDGVHIPSLPLPRATASIYISDQPLLSLNIVHLSAILHRPPAIVSICSQRGQRTSLLRFLTPSFPSSLLPFLTTHSTSHTSQLAADLVVDGEGSLIAAQLGDNDASGKLIRMARRGMTSSVRLRLYYLSLHTLPLNKLLPYTNSYL